LPQIIPQQDHAAFDHPWGAGVISQSSGVLLRGKFNRGGKIMGATENKELIRNMFAELSKGNGQAFLDTMADNVRFTIIGTSMFSGTFNGKQEFVNKVLMPLSAQLEGGLTIAPENFIAEGDYVAMQARGDSRTKSGGTYNNTYCQVFRVANGKVQEVTEYLDTELVTRAFGK
jgi:ketosteroid isomerase-like protein